MELTATKERFLIAISEKLLLESHKGKQLRAFTKDDYFNMVDDSKGIDVREWLRTSFTAIDEKGYRKVLPQLIYDEITDLFCPERDESLQIVFHLPKILSRLIDQEALIDHKNKYLNFFIRCFMLAEDRSAEAVDQTRRLFTEQDEIPQKEYASHAESISAKELIEKDFGERTPIVDGLFYPGLAIIAAPKKTGKSWLMLQLCTAIATGGKFLKFDTRKGEALYLALEDGARREQTRFAQQLQGSDAPEGVHLIFKGIPPIGNGFIEEIQYQADKYPNLKLIVIDVLAKVLPSKKSSEQDYNFYYRLMPPIQAWADSHNILMLFVTHTTKSIDWDNPFNSIMGSTGLTGSTDCNMLLAKQRKADKDAFLFIEGRDNEDENLKLTFNSNTCKWEYLGDFSGNISEANAEDSIDFMRQEYLNSDIRAAIKKIADVSGSTGFTERCTPIINKACDLEVPIREGAKAVGSFLCKYRTYFRTEDQIMVNRLEKTEGDNRGYRYHIQVWEDAADFAVPLQDNDE